MALDIDLYQQSYDADYGFESVLVQARQRLLAERIQSLLPRTVVELGCGRELLVDELRRRGEEIEGVERWIILEPSLEFAAHAKQCLASDSRFEVWHGFAESLVERVTHDFPCGAELVLASSLLHEVKDVSQFLEAAKAMKHAEGILHVNVPNAHSFHRQLARAMGMVGDEQELSTRNLQLGQSRIYDMKRLKQALSAASLRVVHEGGYFMKPWTHAQMESVRQQHDFMDDTMLDGLWTLGRENPAMAAEIFIESQ